MSLLVKMSVTNERGLVGRVGRVGCEFICGWLWVCGFDLCGFVSLWVMQVCELDSNVIYVGLWVCGLVGL